MSVGRAGLPGGPPPPPALVQLMVPADAHRGPSPSSCRSQVAMDDLGENTTVLSTLRSLNNFISQRVEAGSGLDAPASAQGSLQMQYQESMQVSAPGGRGSAGGAPGLQVGRHTP